MGAAFRPHSVNWALVHSAHWTGLTGQYLFGTWEPCTGTAVQCASAESWSQQWTPTSELSFNVSLLPDADALPPCQSRDLVVACVFSGDGRGVHAGWLSPVACEGAYELPLNSSRCPLSEDMHVDGQLGAPFTFMYTLRYANGQSSQAVGVASSSVSLSDGGGMPLVAVEDCGEGTALGLASTGSCSFVLAHLGSLSVGLHVEDEYGQAYEMPELLAFDATCPVHKSPSSQVAHRLRLHAASRRRNKAKRGRRRSPRRTCCST